MQYLERVKRRLEREIKMQYLEKIKRRLENEEEIAFANFEEYSELYGYDETEDFLALV